MSLRFITDPATERELYPRSESKRFTVYRVGLRMLDKLVGGVPNDPNAIEGWIKSRTLITDEAEQADLMVRTLRDLGVPIPQEATREEVAEAAREVAATTHAVGFKRDERGAYLESRCVKAGIKECVNILYAGERWGKTSKGPKSYAAERIFAWPDRLYLDDRPSAMIAIEDPETAAKFAREGMGPNLGDGRLLFTGHTSGPKGPVSTLTYYQYVTKVRIEFDLLVCDDCIKAEHWREIFEHFQDNGLGTLRSQGHGRFSVVRFEKLLHGTPLLGGFDGSAILEHAISERVQFAATLAD